MTTPSTLHYVYNDNGSLTIWDGQHVDSNIGITADVDTHVVQVYVSGVPVLRFESKDAPRSARILANVIFQINKEFAS